MKTEKLQKTNTKTILNKKPSFWDRIAKASVESLKKVK